MVAILEQHTLGSIKIISQTKLVLHIEHMGEIMEWNAVQKLNVKNVQAKDVMQSQIQKSILLENMVSY